MLHVGAPTLEDSANILIEILDLRHPLTFDQPLLKLLPQKRASKRKLDPDFCSQPTKLKCASGMHLI